MAEMEFEKEEDQQSDSIITMTHEDGEDPAPVAESIKEDMLNYDVFGNVIKESLSDRVKAKSKATSATKSPPIVTPKAKAEPNKIVGMDYTVFYAGHRIEVPENDLTIESLRAYLETDFPEMSKERTDMLIDEEKLQIVPVIKSPKKG